MAIQKNEWIELFEVKSGDKIALIVNPESGIIWNKISLTAHILENGEFVIKQFDLTSAFTGSSSISKSIPIEYLHIVGKPALYQIKLEGYRLQDNEFIVEGICSNVLGVYRCLLADILKETGCNSCLTVSDEVIRNYLILYGHVIALKECNLEEAKEYFKILQNCFSKCSAESSCGNINTKSSCNCSN